MHFYKHDLWCTVELGFLLSGRRKFELNANSSLFAGGMKLTEIDFISRRRGEAGGRIQQGGALGFFSRIRPRAHGRRHGVGCVNMARPLTSDTK